MPVRLQIKMKCSHNYVKKAQILDFGSDYYQCVKCGYCVRKAPKIEQMTLTEQEQRDITDKSLNSAKLDDTSFFSSGISRSNAHSH
jgi:hypothetical protein